MKIVFISSAEKKNIAVTYQSLSVNNVWNNKIIENLDKVYNFLNLVNSQYYTNLMFINLYFKQSKCYK